MKRLLFGLLCLCCAAQVVAQTAALEPVSSQDYERIEALRALESANLDALEAACYQRFAVNDCLKKVQSRRIALLADLRRQEARLHDRERQILGAEALQRLEQKALERKQLQDDIQAEGGVEGAQEKLREQQSKQAEHAAKAASGSAPVAKQAPTGPTAAEQSQARASYERKQADAERKRQELAKRLAEKAAKPVKPLPVPP
jgi:TolA-binding protein